MATQTNLHPNAPTDTPRVDAPRSDARSRADDLTREYVATEGGQAAAERNDKPDVGVSSNLLHLLQSSAQMLRHTAENVENRGLKLLLKVVAQERVSMSNTLRQAMGQGADNPLAAGNTSSARSLQQGLQDIQTGMTVKQQGRENVSLTHLVEEEKELLAAYDAALEGNPTSIKGELESQRTLVAHFYERLQAVSEGVEPIVARVFDTRIEGESAVTRLRERGLDASQIDAATISQVTRPVVRTTIAPSGPKNTMAAGAFAGVIVGGIVGLALASYVWFAPQLAGWVTVGPWGLLIGAAVIGGVLGTVFGLFIGQSQREDDLAVTADGVVNGEYIVATYPKSQQVAMVEDVLQVHHARELNR